LFLDKEIYGSSIVDLSLSTIVMKKAKKDYTLLKSIVQSILLRALFQHFNNKNTGTFCWFFDKHMRYCTNELVILYNGTSAHPLNNTARFLYKTFIDNVEGKRIIRLFVNFDIE